MGKQEYNSIIRKGLSSVSKTIEAQKDAVINLDNQYKTDEFSRLNLLKSLDILLSTKIKGGKIVLCGIGKSYKICSKLCATLNSLSIQSVTLHPTEALHGDLGILNDKDCILMLTASGNTPELINLLPHIPKIIPIILLTCSKSSKLAHHQQIKSLLYTELPNHLKEDTIHGIPAPTVSASLSLILADSVILSLAELLEEDVLIRKKTFSMKHPGGSIGANLSHLNDNLTQSSTPLSQNLSQNSAFNSTRTSSSSNSSFLSLNQIRNGLSQVISDGGGGSSLSNSDADDDEDDNNNDGCSNNEFKDINIGLSNIIKVTEPHKILYINSNDLNNLTEFEYLKNITIFQYWIIKNDKLAIDSTDLRFYYNTAGNDWNEFSSTLISRFQKIKI